MGGEHTVVATRAARCGKMGADALLAVRAEPKASYEVVIVGGGSHGLATAYYLAKHHGITDVCVVEKGWLAGGNMARNTTIIRSNYLWDESAAIYEHSLKLWEGSRTSSRSTSSSPSEGS